jgi:uncharacterized protein (DUF1800 family)
MTVAGCGGGGPAGTEPPPWLNAISPGPAPARPAIPSAPTAPLAPEPVTPQRAARFLSQAAFAATDASLAQVQALGYEGWLDEQFGSARTQGHWDWMVAKGYQTTANVNSFAGVDNTLWRKLVGSPDALRQRMVLALSEIFVVSMAGLPVTWRGFLVADYLDRLEQHAFGTYRDLLGAVTLSNAMGVYLNMRGNQKADPATGRQPDENYAREVLQLFSIGVVELNPDGSLRGGLPQESYAPQTISELARVFTGWDFDGFSRTDAAWTRRPMVNLANRHDTGSKTVLGTVIPAGTPADVALDRVLDTIAQHPNVAPFVSRQLIQRLVSSAPSAAYAAGWLRCSTTTARACAAICAPCSRPSCSTRRRGETRWGVTSRVDACSSRWRASFSGREPSD